MAQLDLESFALYVRRLRGEIENAGYPVQEKPLNYGCQLLVACGETRAFVNIYNGKKGLNLVFGGNAELKAELADLACCKEKPGYMPAAGKSPLESKKQRLVPAGHMVWAGSDESGKGDFFGSLVVAAVAVDADAAEKLIEAGVKDCKQLADKQVLELAAVVKSLALAHSVLDLKPRFYNQRYREVSQAGGKLNQLLASGHIRALSLVLTQRPDCSFALIDQFAKDLGCVQELKSKFPQCEVRQQPGAEADIAVAAASVLARARFLTTLEELAKAAGLASLPKGGGSGATACAQELVARIGLEALTDYVKLHFANYRHLKDGKWQQ